MKKLVLTGIAIVSVAAGAMAQGTFAVDNSVANGYFTVNGTFAANPANAYSGAFGMEVWALAGSTIPANLASLTASAGYAITAYNALSTDGFTQAGGTLTGTMSLGVASGVTGGNITLPAALVTPAGSSVIVGLAVWNNSAANFSAAIKTAGALAGVGVFSQPTAVSPPSPPATLNLNNDLVMMSVPEPGTFALAGLGAAALLIFRRRK